MKVVMNQGGLISKVENFDDKTIRICESFSEFMNNIITESNISIGIELDEIQAEMIHEMYCIQGLSIGPQVI